MSINYYNTDFFRLQDKTLCIEKITEETIDDIKYLVAYVNRIKTDSFVLNVDLLV